MIIAAGPKEKCLGIELEVREWPYLEKGLRHTAIEVLFEGKRVLMSYYLKPEVRSMYVKMAAERVINKQDWADSGDAS